MSYYFSKVLSGKGFDETIEQVTAELKKEGFGILSDINVSETLKNRIGVDFKKYRILGACNPHFAHKSLSVEDKIGVFLPCNVVVEENENGLVEVSAVDPVSAMMSVNNPALTDLATEIQQKLQRVIGSL